MGMKPFNSYFAEYKEFYEGILKLAELEDKYLKEEPSFEEVKKYQKNNVPPTIKIAGLR